MSFREDHMLANNPLVRGLLIRVRDWINRELGLTESGRRPPDPNTFEAFRSMRVTGAYLYIAKVNRVYEERFDHPVNLASGDSLRTNFREDTVIEQDEIAMMTFEGPGTEGVRVLYTQPEKKQ